MHGRHELGREHFKYCERTSLKLRFNASASTSCLTNYYARVARVGYGAEVFPKRG